MGDDSADVVSVKTKFVAEKVARGRSTAGGITAQRHLASKDITIKTNT